MTINCKLAPLPIVAWLMTGCSEAPSSVSFTAQNAAAAGYCLTHFGPGGIEFVPLDRPQWTYPIRVQAANGATVSFGRLSPGGEFVVVRTASDDLLGVALDGKLLWMLNNAGAVSTPAISPDAKKAIFSNGREFVIYDVSTGDLKKLSVNGQHPAWAPHGDRFAFDDGLDVSVYDLVRNATVQIGRGTIPLWSPNDHSIAVTEDLKSVVVIDLETRNRSEMLSGSLFSIPGWSPNGRWFSYTRPGGPHWWSGWDGTEPKQLIIRDTDTGSEAVVGAFAKGHAGDYTWVRNERVCHMTA